MTQSLFFEPNVQFEKVAAEVMLPEDANLWPNEIMQEVFRQVSYIADFEPHVTMDRVDAERGYGFGHVEVQNKTEIQHGAPPDAMQAAGIKSARIPIIIKDRKLQPLDLLVTEDAKVLPLTEARLRGAIFRPQVFDITGRGPGDMSMIGQLYPPYRQNYGFGGGGASMNVGMGKEGAAGWCTPAEAWSRLDRMTKKGSVLTTILSTIRETDYQRFFGKFASDRGLQAQYVANGAATGDALKCLAAYEPGGVRKMAGAVLANLKPTVVQLCKEVEGYSLKTASSDCWSPSTCAVDRGEALRSLGSKVVLAADMAGSATATLDEGVSEEGSPEADLPVLADHYGIYKVQDEQGRHLVGFVFPNLIDIDGTSLPIALFTNGSQYSVQGEVAGCPAGEGASLFEGPPRGMGAFYRTLGNGHAEAMVPMTIKATMDSPEQGGVTMHAETFDGREVQVIVQPNLQAPTLEGEHLLIPDTFSWLPLDAAEKTSLVGNPEEFNKEGAAKRALASVTVRCGGADSFSIDGVPVDKLASDARHFLSLDDTLFLLGGLGVDLDYAQKKLGQAAAWSKPVDVRVGRYIKTASDRMHEATVKAASVLSQMPDLQQDLVKEAAVIPDPVAVDTVLSLGFLNPENLGVFISYLPAIDEAQHRMCELLLGARLGLRDITASALEKAIRSTEETLEGLKILAFQRA